MKKGIWIALAAFPTASAAFFDPFDGNSLAAHWDTYSEGSGWVHSVTGGALSVTELNGPFEFDEFNIYAPIEGFQDFTAEMRVMWDTGTHQTLSFGLAEVFPQSPWIGVMRYAISPGGSGTVSATLHTGGAGSADAPAPNAWHLLRIDRTGTLLEARVDGNLIASTATAVGDRANRVFLHFGGPENEAFGTFLVDYVRVVPEPLSALTLMLGAGIALRGKSRKRRPTPHGRPSC